MLAPGNGGVVQVAPALPLTPRRASPIGGEGRGAGAAVVDVDMGGTGSVGVLPASEKGGSGCGSDCGAVLAGVRMEMASQVRRMRKEVMGAIGLLRAECGLGTWEEGRRLENTRGRLERERAAAQREHEVFKVAERVSAGMEARVIKEREAAAEVEAAEKRQKAEDVARAERLAALRKNLDVAAESVRGAKTEAERSAGCEALTVAHNEVKRAEALAPVSTEVVTAGLWSAVVGVVTRKVEVVTRLSGPVGQARTAELKGVVENVQPLVRQRGHTSWAVSTVVWMEHEADEILWRVTGVGKNTIDEVVRSALVDDVSAVVGGDLFRDSWVEDRLSRYVVVKNVPEAEWLKDGVSKLKGEGGERVWGWRLPVVVGRVGRRGAERVSIKLEVVSGVVAANLVKGGATFLGVRKELELAVRGGGARVLRPAGQGNPSVVGCFCCWDRGHVQRFCPRGGAVAVASGRAGRCWGCGGVGPHASECFGRSLPVPGADGSFSQGLFGGGLKHGGGDVAGAPESKGGPIRGGSMLGYVNRSLGPVGVAPLGAR